MKFSQIKVYFCLYTTGIHLPLLIIASISSVTIIIPFLILGIFGSFCLRYRLVNKIRPVIDSIHGPYKDHYRFWYGARLFLLVVIAVLNPSLGDQKLFYKLLLQLFVVCIFTTFQAYIKPFSSHWINVLDIWCMLNVISFIFLSIYSIYEVSLSQSMLLFNIIPMSITIIIVFCYHTMLFVRRMLSKFFCRSWKTSHSVTGFFSDKIDFNYWLSSNSRAGYINIDDDKEDDNRHEACRDLTNSCSTRDYSKLRESLLELSTDSTPTIK